MEQGKIMEAEASTVWVGATPTGLIAPPPPQPPPRFFTGWMPPSCHPTNSVKALKVGVDIICFNFVYSIVQFIYRNAFSHLV